MSRAWRRALKWLSVALVALLLLAAAMWLRPAWTPAIHSAAGVASLEAVDLNGSRQWILIRGEDRDTPLLLFLHGGPGMPAMYLAHAATRELEKDFVVVHWDRRDAGKSFDPHMPADKESVSQQLADAEALIGLLRQRLGARPALLVGHFWGSYLGVLLVQRHPEWFAAYVDNKGAGAARITSTKVSRSVGGQEIPTTYVEGVKVVPAQASFTKFVRLAPQYFEAIQKDVPLEVRLETRFRCERGLDEPFLVKIACGAVPSYRNSHPTHDRARMPSETLRIFPLAQRAGRRGRLRSAPPGPPPDSFARPHLPGALGVPR